MGIMGKTAGALGGAGKGLLKTGGGGLAGAVTGRAAGSRGPIRAPGGPLRTIASRIASKRSMTGGRR